MNFQCQESCAGKCCKVNWDGQAHFVFLTKHDRIRLSAHLQKPIVLFASYGEFARTRFTNQKSRQWFLNLDNGKCPFLKEGKCGVYEARPIQCRTFPFWPENVATPTRWKMLEEFCPGINKGYEVTHQFLDLQIKADKELCNPNK